MSIRLAQAYVEIVPSMKGVGRAIAAGFGDNSGKIGGSEGAKAGKGFAHGLTAKGAIIGAASAITSKAMGLISSSIGGAVSRVDQMNNFPKVMKNLGYSSSDAAKQVKKMADRLQGLPTSLDAMTGMVQILAPVSKSLGEATDISLAFNDALLAGGKSTVIQSNAMEQYSQMLAAGKPDLQAWRSIQSAMPGQLNQIAQSLLGTGHNAMDLYEAMKEGNVTFDDFNRALMDLDKNGLKGFAGFERQARDATNGIATSGENMATRFKNAIAKVIDAIGGENIASAINKFSSSFDGIGNAAADIVKGVKRWLGELYAELKKNGAIDSFAQSFKRLRDAIKTVTDKAINWAKMIPPEAAANALKKLADAVKWLGDAVKWVGDNSDWLLPIATAIASIVLAGKGLSLVSNGLNGIAKVADTVADGMTGLASTFGIVKNAQKAWNSVTKAGKAVWTAFNAVLSTNPVLLIIGVIVALTAALVVFFTKTKTGRKMWASFIDWLKKAWKNVSEFFTDLWNGITGTFSDAAKSVKDAWNGVSGWFKARWDGIVGTARDAAQSLKNTWNGFTRWLSDIWDKVFNDLKKAWNAIKEFLSGIMRNIQGIVSNGFIVIGAVIVWPLKQIQKLIDKAFTWMDDFIRDKMENTSGTMWRVWNGIHATVDTVWTLIRNIISTAINAIRTVVVTVLDLIKGDWQGAWDTVKDFFETTWNGIVSFFDPLIANLKNNLGVALNWISTTWNNTWDSVKNFFTNAWNAIVSFFKPIINDLKNTLGAALNWISTTWNNTWDSVKNFFTNAWNGMVNTARDKANEIGTTATGIKDTVVGAFKDAGNWLVDAGKHIVNGLMDGIKSKLGGLKETVGNMGHKVVDWAKGVLDINSPSRVFREQVGVMIGRGMAEGIDKSSGTVQRSMDAMASLKPKVNLKYGLDEVMNDNLSRQMKPTGRPSWGRPVQQPGFTAGRQVNITQNIDASGIRDEQALCAYADERARMVFAQDGGLR